MNKKTEVKESNIVQIDPDVFREFNEQLPKERRSAGRFIVIPFGLPADMVAEGLEDITLVHGYVGTVVEARKG